ncbi:MAG TPA: hypothetical protein VKR06_16240, partial [Ktedonosporobacter sp.]|nr:hypothetical protein [Ktedonosporobacter sp.]
MGTPGSETSIGEIAGMLTMRKRQGQPLTLLLGSRAGGLFGNVDFYEIVQKFSLLDFDKRSSWEQFQECYRVLDGDRFDAETISGILERVLSSLDSREEDQPLARLIKAGFFEVILTTNIDSSLEDAFWDESGSRQIIKIFGDLKQPGYKTVGQEFDLEEDKAFKAFLRAQLGREVLIIGYDSLWDRPIVEALPATGGA